MEGLVQFPKAQNQDITQEYALLPVHSAETTHTKKKDSNKIKNKIHTEQCNKAKEKQQVKI